MGNSDIILSKPSLPWSRGFRLPERVGVKAGWQDGHDLPSRLSGPSRLLLASDYARVALGTYAARPCVFDVLMK
jgi:hypothetical protein